MPTDESDDERDVCGSTDTDSGEPCKRPAGWGRDADTGYCTTHYEDDDTEPGRPAHRPTKLTFERQERIANMLEDGHSIVAACRSNGIGTATFHEWVARGEEQEEGIFADFSERVTRARAEGERSLAELTKQTALEKQDARTLFKMLATQYPESWGDLDDAPDAEEEQGGLNIVIEPQTPEQN